MGKNKYKHNSRHHVIPRSRGGDSNLENITLTKKKFHQYYHILFDNRRPEEIVEMLVKKYWKGNWDYVETAYRRNNERT